MPALTVIIGGSAIGIILMLGAIGGVLERIATALEKANANRPC